MVIGSSYKSAVPADLPVCPDGAGARRCRYFAQPGAGEAAFTECMASVTIQAVKKNFGERPILHGVDIDIADGSFTVLVGPSGCGKSTLLRMIAGLEQISGGEIRIGDRRVNDLPPKERDIAMVFQNYALYPHMTVRENMAFSLMLAKTGQGRRSTSKVGARRRDPGARRAARPLSAPALGRPAPARGDGPRDRARPAGVPVRRAAVQPRRQAARGDAQRDQGAAPAPEDHLDLRHARPDRGHDHGRQDRRHARRPRSSRPAARWSCTTTRPTSSWPASSARRR